MSSSIELKAKKPLFLITTNEIIYFYTLKDAEAFDSYLKEQNILIDENRDENCLTENQKTKINVERDTSRQHAAGCLL